MILFGYGKTTRAIAKRFGNCKVYDDKFSAYTMDKYGNEFYPSEDYKGGDELAVTSPGIPPSNPLIKRAKNLISEYDLFADRMPKSVWISGTNGKTTTTDMIYHLLKERGAVSGGNIGSPLADLPSDAPLWILETSSFTLHYTKKAKPDIYVLLPITPDHISWHGSFEEYERAKLKPLEMMDESGVVIVPQKYEHVHTKAKMITYSSSDDLASYFGIDMDKINFKEPFLLDALLAMGVERILFDELDYELINTYKIGAHRVEEFIDKKGRVWINDSKATNADATIAALGAFKYKKIYLILGGDDKGADMGELFKFLKGLDVKIFAIGSNAEKLMELAKAYAIKATLSNELERAVKAIDKLHGSDAVAMLSPAAASLDQFDSYAQRGEKFLEFVKELR